MSKKRLFTIKRTAALNSSIISAPESMIKKNLIILKKIEKFSPMTTLKNTTDSNPIEENQYGLHKNCLVFESVQGVSKRNSAAFVVNDFAI